MSRLLSMIIGLNLLACTANAQWMYPRGYSGYGMSRWGSDPAAGYMAGLGSFARSQGVYQLDKARADSINADTVIKWNKALRARQAALREERRRKAIRQEAELDARVKRMNLRDGTTLNNLLYQILDVDPSVARSAHAKTPISPSAIREIPFEWDSEAITICIDQMTGTNSLPGPLLNPRFVDDRSALRSAVEQAMKEDAQGSVSSATSNRISGVVASFRTKFLKHSADYISGYQDALDYFSTLASLTRLLNDPSMKAFLEKLNDGEERTVGDLVAFMNSHNLRFGPVTSDRQIEIYTRLVPALIAIRDEPKPETLTASTPDQTGENLRAAARDAFKGMSWDQLEAHRLSR